MTTVQWLAKNCLVKEVHNKVMQDCRWKVSEFTMNIGISDETTFCILTVELGLETFLARWCPGNWQWIKSIGEGGFVKKVWIVLIQLKQISSINLLQQMKLGFTVISFKIKQQSKQWTHSGSPRLKKKEDTVCEISWKSFEDDYLPTC